MLIKGKTVLTAAALVIVIGGGVLLYNALKDRAPLTALPGTSQAAQPAGAGQSASPGAPQQTQAAKRVKAPDFTVHDAKGNAVKLSDMLGKPVVLNFWASWCPPCKSEMPEFNKVYEELGGDVTFMMVDAADGSRETAETGAAYVAGQGFTFPVYYDVNQDAVTRCGIRAFPTSLFIDAEGYVVTGAEGVIDEAALRKGIGLISAAAGPAEYHKISPQDAKALMDGGKPYILLDVRTDAEYNEKHIEGAVLIPDYEIAGRAAAELPDKSALILVYCRSGNRSAGAAKQLVKLGYTNVYDFGGINSWPYGTVSGK